MRYFFVFLSLSIMVFGNVSMVLSANSPTNLGGNESPYNQGGTESPVHTAQSLSIDNPISAKSITQLFQTLIDIVMVFAVPIIVFFIIYAGFLYVTARGSEEIIKKAHAALLYAIIGGVLILGANVLIQVVQGTVDGVTGIDHESI